MMEEQTSRQGCLQAGASACACEGGRVPNKAAPSHAEMIEDLAFTHGHMPTHAATRGCQVYTRWQVHAPRPHARSPARAHVRPPRAAPRAPRARSPARAPRARDHTMVSAPTYVLYATVPVRATDHVHAVGQAPRLGDRAVARLLPPPPRAYGSIRRRSLRLRLCSVCLRFSLRPRLLLRLRAFAPSASASASALALSSASAWALALSPAS